MKKNTHAVTKMLVKGRRLIQGLVGLGIFFSISVLGISLWWLLAAGALSGILFGKVFCRWACPMGFIMEIVTGTGGANSKFQQMYQYHKLGCPIAWTSGALNRFSLFRIKLNKTECTNCGLCDKACYLSAIEGEKFSLHDEIKENPGRAFACSKCLACVTACPTGCISYRP